MKNRKIKILGAGISGLSAAIHLAKAGYPVDVFERNITAGGRHHGDLQGLENWTQTEDVLTSLKRMNIEINFEAKPFYSVFLSDNKRIRATHTFDQPLCYLVKRGSVNGSLDQGLASQAQDLGVNIFFNQSIPMQEADIVAIGPNPKEIFALAKGIVFKTTFKDGLYVVLDNRLAYKGYAYLLISSGYGCMCTVMFGKYNRIKKYFQKVETAFLRMLDLPIENRRAFGGIGGFSLTHMFQQQRSLFIGEFAGLQDLLWGFGIRTSIESGFLAAQSIVSGKDHMVLTKKHFEKKLKASLVDRFLFELCGFFGYSLLIHLTRNISNSFYFLYKSHQFTRIHQKIYPIARVYMKLRYPNLRI